MDPYKKKLLRDLKNKSLELKGDLEYTKSIYQVSVNGFCLAINNYCEQKSLDNPLDKISKKIKEDKKKDFSPKLKGLFREIAKKTHTDLSKNESTRSTLESAVEAKKEKDASSLLSIANDLKISTNSLDYKSIEIIESSIKNMEDDINSMKQSYPWVWYHSEKYVKENIIVSFVESQV